MTNTNAKDLFLDKEIQCGGFYELVIQVCRSSFNEPIKSYLDFVWSLDNIDGPYDSNFHSIPICLTNNRHSGMLTVKDHTLPFMTFCIVEEIQSEHGGFCWLDIGIYSATIQKVFGMEYRTWGESPNVPIVLKQFLLSILKQLYAIYPFQLAMVDFEVSGEFYLEDLQVPITKGWTPTTFYVGKDKYNSILEENRKLVTFVEDIPAYE